MKWESRLEYDEIWALMSFHFINKLKGHRTSILERFQSSPFKLVTLLIEKMTANKRAFYSIYGEDALIMGLMDRYTMQTGKQLALSYIDIGAWRPIKGSNTYFLYKKGFTGTVVEPNPHFKRMWNSIRPRDKFLAIGCGTGNFADLQIFHPSAASNTFNSDFAREITNSQPHKITNSVRVPLSSLREIIQGHVTSSTLPFLLDIDIEGMDFEVISSYDFPVGFRPVIILIEDMPPVGDSTDSLMIQNYLAAQKYRLIARTVVTAIYVDENSDLSA